MSVVVAIKNEGVIYMGCDSQASNSRSKFTLTNKNNYKVWKVKNLEEYCMFGGVGSLRDINIIRIQKDLIDELSVIKKSLDFDYVVEFLVPKMFSILDSYNRLVKDSDELKQMSSAYVFSYGGDLYEIGSDGGVIEIDDFTAIGSGSDIALGSLNTTVGKPPIDRIRLAIEASCKTNLYVNYPIIISNSKTEEIELIVSKS